jgi:hypothetical protein
MSLHNFHCIIFGGHFGTDRSICAVLGFYGVGLFRGFFWVIGCRWICWLSVLMGTENMVTKNRTDSFYLCGFYLCSKVYRRISLIVLWIIEHAVLNTRSKNLAGHLKKGNR